LSISSYVRVWSKEQYSLHAIQEWHPPHLIIFVWFELSYTILHRVIRNCFNHTPATQKVNTCKTDSKERRMPLYENRMKYALVKDDSAKSVTFWQRYGTYFGFSSPLHFEKWFYFWLQVKQETEVNLLSWDLWQIMVWQPVLHHNF
jgi:DNA modification methylase